MSKVLANMAKTDVKNRGVQRAGLRHDTRTLLSNFYEPWNKELASRALLRSLLTAYDSLLTTWHSHREHGTDILTTDY